MGIDIYAQWRGMTKANKQAQITGFSVTSGHVGYLREAYHGEPYATKALVPEAFSSDNGKAEIAAALLRERLPAVLRLVAERHRIIYDDTPAEIKRVQKSFSDFVDLCELQEARTGQPTKIIASY